MTAARGARPSLPDLPDPAAPHTRALDPAAPETRALDPAAPVRATDGDASIPARKDDHLRLAADPRVLHARPAGFRAWKLRHRALPERDLADVDLATTFLGVRLAAPVVISSMTGGTERAALVNGRLARVAHERGLAMGLGSGRALLADPSVLRTYAVGPRPPLLLANLGAVQLRRGLSSADAERLVDLLDADGLILHLNAVQEAVQPEGDTTFGGLVERIAAVIERLAPRPVVVKEVGFGIGPEDLALLAPLRPAAIDLAGAGGTNWALVEGARAERARDVGEAFRDWGWSTADLLAEVREPAGAAGIPLVASGGIADGVEAATALALGAAMVGLARPFLVAALDDEVERTADVLLDQLRIAVWAAGAARPADLRPTHLRSA